MSVVVAGGLGGSGGRVGRVMRTGRNGEVRRSFRSGLWWEGASGGRFGRPRNQSKAVDAAPDGT